MLLRSREVGPAVACVTIFACIRADRPLLTKADCFQLFARDAEGDQGIFGSSRTAVTEGQVVLSRTTLIAMPLDRDNEVSIHLEDGFERTRITLQNRLIAGTNITFVVIEVNILHLARQDLLHALSGSGLHGLRWWRCAYRNSSIAFRGPTGSGGGEVIGSRRGRVDATAAIRTYLSNLIIDLNTGSIAHRPTQRGWLACGNHRWLSRKVINNWFGYRVMVAENGKQGVELFAQWPDEFSVVLLDLTMPVMDGEEALGHLLRLRPKAKVLILSGYDGDEVLRKLGNSNIAGFLQKPFSAGRLRAKIREILMDKSGVTFPG